MRLFKQGRSTLSIAALLALFFPRSSWAEDPQAVSVSFGPDFLGYDGLWSPAQIRVGSPEQYLLVFPSTTSSETWVAGPGLCTDATCASRRGGIYYTGNSTTWNSLGQYELGFSALTETTQDGAYGFDSIAISDTLSASDQIIAVVDSVEQWDGQLGMGVGQTRFQNNTNYLAFLSTLVQNNSAIPSHSYSYTAGASYQGSGVAGSLTLGGADTSRYTSNNFWFDLATGYLPAFAVKSIQISSTSKDTGWTSNPLQVFSQDQAAMFTLDSSTPFLWLPEAVCDSIAEALGLTWNPAIELYVLNSTSAQDLTDLGLEFTFNLAKSVDSNEMLSLKLSYGAFNLQLSYPFPGLFDSYSDEKVAYFPLRRANNTLQYTIGRAFLQEVYLIVDYERNSFSLSQALFPDSSQPPQLAQITRPDDSEWPGPKSSTGSKGISTAAKAGIAVGVALAVSLVAGLVWYCRMRKKTKDSDVEDEKTQRGSIFSRLSKRTIRNPSVSASAAELTADRLHPSEMFSDASNSRFELSAAAPVEMAAADVPPNFFQTRNNAKVVQRNDPRSPVELVSPPPRSSISEDGSGTRTTDQGPVPSTPAYSPAEIGQRYSKALSSSSHPVSPFSTRRSGNPSQSGSDHIISPITGSSSNPNRSSRGNFSEGGSESSRLLSPISPVRARSERDHPIQMQDMLTTSHHHHQSLSQASDTNPLPKRTPSRDSRFKEEITDTGTPPETIRHSDTPSMKLDGSQKPRFSWDP